MFVKSIAMVSMKHFEQYRDRKIEFHGVVENDTLKVKIYTISLNEHFSSNEILEKLLEELPELFNKAGKTDLSTYGVAFLIIHEAREGVWILPQWWTGGEMLGSDLFFCSYKNPFHVTQPIQDQSLICVWELQVVLHEREAWIKHILMKADNPDFDSYLNDYM